LLTYSIPNDDYVTNNYTYSIAIAQPFANCFTYSNNFTDGLPHFNSVAQPNTLCISKPVAISIAKRHSDSDRFSNSVTIAQFVRYSIPDTVTLTVVIPNTLTDRVFQPVTD
jgi:hypothetical protein